MESAAADAEVPEGMDIPAELEQRKDRLKASPRRKRRWRYALRKAMRSNGPGTRQNWPNARPGPRRPVNGREASI